MSIVGGTYFTFCCTAFLTIMLTVQLLFIYITTHHCCWFFLYLSFLLVSIRYHPITHTHTHTHTHLTALFPGLPRWAGTRKVKPISILLEQETVSGSGISWAVCKSAPRSRQITTPAPHHSVFYRPDALPATQPTASKHWITLTSQTLHALFGTCVTKYIIIAWHSYVCVCYYYYYYTCLTTAFPGQLCKPVLRR